MVSGGAVVVGTVVSTGEVVAGMVVVFGAVSVVLTKGTVVVTGGMGVVSSGSPAKSPPINRIPNQINRPVRIRMRTKRIGGQ
jgi:hypothetical protein